MAKQTKQTKPADSAKESAPNQPEQNLTAVNDGQMSDGFQTLKGGTVTAKKIVPKLFLEMFKNPQRTTATIAGNVTKTEVINHPTYGDSFKFSGEFMLVVQNPDNPAEKVSFVSAKAFLPPSLAGVVAAQFEKQGNTLTFSAKLGTKPASKEDDAKKGKYEFVVYTTKKVDTALSSLIEQENKPEQLTLSQS